jgi:hypothetical protein
MAPCSIFLAGFEEGRRKKEEGRRKKEEAPPGRGDPEAFFYSWQEDSESRGSFGRTFSSEKNSHLL